MKRRFDPAQPEWMDRPQPVTPELTRDLANIRSLNRWFGSYRQIRHFLQRWLEPNSNVRILDVATGSGDIPRLIVELARGRKIRVEVEAIDQQRSTIEIARQLSGDYPEINFSCANLFDFNPPAPFDIVICSLALHHFSEDDAVAVLKKLRTLSGAKVLVADLRRGRWLSLGTYLLTAFFYREPMTRNDARVSVAAAFSFGELSDLAEQAGWENFGHARFAVGRQAVWIDASSRAEPRDPAAGP